jgi:glycosyltransferase involved in cell wall biosynthesis
MDYPLISIITPLYNIEKHLKKSLDSLVAQTYPNIEFILVDDGSEDSTGQICDDYAKNDPRFRVIHQTNGGISNARNNGLAIAKGELIGSVDGDDWVEPNLYESLYNNMVAFDADLSACDFAHEYADKTKLRNPPTETPVLYEGKTMFHAGLIPHRFGVYFINKLFRRSIIDKLKKGHELFDETLHVSEDQLFVAEYCLLSKRAVFLQQPLYHYRRHAESATGSVSINPRALTLLDSTKKLQDFYKIHAPEYLHLVDFRYLRYNLSIRYHCLKTNRDPKLLERLNKNIKALYWPVLDSGKVSFKGKVYIVLFTHCPRFAMSAKSIYFFLKRSK